MKNSKIIFFVLFFLLISINIAQENINRYEAADGKIMAIWPHNNRFK